MSTDPEVIVRRLYDEVWNRGNIAVVGDLLAPTLIDHTPLPTQSGGIDGFEQFVAMVAVAFPDLHMTLDDVIASEDKVVCRWSARGTNTGPLLGLAPSGERITLDGIDIFRVERGKVMEHWGRFDAIGLLQQLGMIPHLHLAHMQA